MSDKVGGKAIDSNANEIAEQYFARKANDEESKQATYFYSLNGNGGDVFSFDCDENRQGEDAAELTIKLRTLTKKLEWLERIDQEVRKGGL